MRELLVVENRGPRVLQQGTRVIVLSPAGALSADMTWEGAKALGNALLSVALKAEEWAKAEAIARDAAILLRAGFPFGLTSHPAIQKEAAKIAAWDRNLRRYLPGGIKSEEMVGTPTFSQAPPSTNGGSS